MAAKAIRENAIFFMVVSLGCLFDRSSAIDLFMKTAALGISFKEEMPNKAC